MSSAKLIDRNLLLLILVLTAGFHLFMTWVLRGNVPSNSPFWQWVWGSFAALPLTGTFFLAANMFTMVLVDQLRRRG